MVFETGSRHRIDEGDTVHFVAEKLNAGGIVRSAEENVHRIPLDPEGTALEIRFRPVIEGVDNPVQEPGHGHLLPFADRHGLVMEVVRVPDAVQAGYAGDNDDIPPPGHQRRRGTDPEFVDLVVDAQVLLNIRVCRRNIGFRLVIVIVGDEILDSVVRKKSLEFTIKLGGEGFVVTQHEGRTLQPLDDIGHGESLARSRHAEERYGIHALVQGATEPVNGCRLVAGRLVCRLESEFHNTKIHRFFAFSIKSKNWGNICILGKKYLILHCVSQVYPCVRCES